MTTVNSNRRSRCTPVAWQWLGVWAVLIVWGPAWAQDPAKLPYVIELEEYSSIRKVKESAEYRQSVRKRFPLADRKVSDWLSRIVVGPMNNPEQNGLTVILYSHGARGFVWALDLLADSRTDTIWARRNLVWALRLYDYREAYILEVVLLDDKRTVPPLPRVKRIGEHAGSLPPKSAPMRVCDHAFNGLCLRPWREDLPADWKKRTITSRGLLVRSVPMAERDKAIGILKAWLAEEGERLVVQRKPSVIEEILKPPKKE